MCLLSWEFYAEDDTWELLVALVSINSIKTTESQFHSREMIYEAFQTDLVSLPHQRSWMCLSLSRADVDLAAGYRVCPGSFGDPILKDQVLRIPVRVEPRPNNSLHVLSFTCDVVEDRISIYGKLHLPGNAPSERDALIVPLPNPMRPQYWLVYTNPDGSSTLIRRIDVSSGTQVRSAADDSTQSARDVRDR